MESGSPIHEGTSGFGSVERELEDRSPLAGNATDAGKTRKGKRRKRRRADNGASFLPSFSNPAPFKVQNAARMGLDWRATTPAAIALIDAVLDRVMVWEGSEKPRQRQRSGRQLASLRLAAGAIIGGVLRAWRKDGRMVYCSSNKEVFNGTALGARQMRFLFEALHEVDLVHRWTVYRRGRDPSGWFAARFWPGPRLLAMAAEAGVAPSTVTRDFTASPVDPKTYRPPVIKNFIRLTQIGSEASRKGRMMSFDASMPIPTALREEVMRHNAFAAKFAFEGCVPPVWTRSFQGDWLLGGRWYSHGPRGLHYQTMPSADRVNLIKIEGEPVAEIDIKACFLTLAHGALGLDAPPEPDPYVIESNVEARPAVKTWINCTLGNGKPIGGWPPDHQQRMTAFGYSHPSKVEPLVLRRYPFLRDGLRHIVRDFGHLEVHPNQIVIHRLTAIEAAIVTDVMATMLLRGVLVLPMHDGIIVPLSVADDAAAALKNAGRRIAGVDLRLTVDRPEDAPR